MISIKRDPKNEKVMVYEIVHNVYSVTIKRDNFSLIWSDNVKKDVLKLTGLYKL